MTSLLVTLTNQLVSCPASMLHTKLNICDDSLYVPVPVKSGLPMHLQHGPSPATETHCVPSSCVRLFYNSELAAQKTLIYAPAVRLAVVYPMQPVGLLHTHLLYVLSSQVLWRLQRWLCPKEALPQRQPPPSLPGHCQRLHTGKMRLWRNLRPRSVQQLCSKVRRALPTRSVCQQ